MMKIFMKEIQFEWIQTLFIIYLFLLQPIFTKILQRKGNWLFIFFCGQVDSVFLCLMEHKNLPLAYFIWVSVPSYY